MVPGSLAAPLTPVSRSVEKVCERQREGQDADAPLLSGQVLPDSISVIEHVLLDRTSLSGSEESPQTVQILIYTCDQ